MADQENLGEQAADVSATWGRIEGWLRDHAPASAALLRPPAGETEIAAVEERIGLKFPPVLRAWYRLHDGVDDSEVGAAGFLPGNQGWYRLEQMASAYELHVRDWGYEPGRVPISCTPGDVWYGRYIDARPGEPDYGNLGRWAADEEPEPIPTFGPGWPLAVWLIALADALEEGRCLVEPEGRRDEYNWPALTADGSLTWVDPRDERLADGGVLLDGPR